MSFVFLSVKYVKLNTICGILSFYLAWDLFSLSIDIIQNKSKENAIELAFAFFKSPHYLYSNLQRLHVGTSGFGNRQRTYTAHSFKKTAVFILYYFWTFKRFSFQRDSLVFLDFMGDLRGNRATRLFHELQLHKAAHVLSVWLLISQDLTSLSTLRSQPFFQQLFSVERYTFMLSYWAILFDIKSKVRYNVEACSLFWTENWWST